ncbi:peptidylprolyl isomerase [Deinococcus sp. Marseille-Q6407]|uniref:peptidylprolyl isomerase n=1 Tax=Deinococcus sp. Marseille-Q6407 TaxID=2969223 RepID=UPI0021BE512C|nr:peptidylprolyl isomerase [Deinococcus sp. Marseille-Q6407]
MNFAKTPALLLTALLGMGALSACQEQTKTTTSSTTTSGAAAGASAAATEASGEAASDTATASAASTSSAPTVTEPGKIPAGYTALDPLSQEPVRKFSEAPKRTLQDGTDYYALFDTSRGQVLIDLLENDTPVTVNNFVHLARNHFYDGTRFHRVIDGFMAQGGDPLSVDESKKAEWGSGGPGYQFPDEIRQNLTFNEPNLLAMANSGPGTNGSQFFITFAPTDFLNGRHTIFGKVVSGQETLSSLTRTATSDGGSEAPIEGAVPDKLLSVRILTKAK